MAAPFIGGFMKGFSDTYNLRRIERLDREMSLLYPHLQAIQLACAYCGSKIKLATDSCPNCGAPKENS